MQIYYWEPAITCGIGVLTHTAINHTWSYRDPSAGADMNTDTGMWVANKESIEGSETKPNMYKCLILSTLERKLTLSVEIFCGVHKSWSWIVYISPHSKSYFHTDAAPNSHPDPWT